MKLCTTKSNPLLVFQVLGYICGLESLFCSLDSLRSSRYQKMEESSTNVTLHDAATSRAVTHESLVPRPAPPPAPRPIVRSQAERAGLSLVNQNYQPPPPPVDLVRYSLQPNHNGGRQLTGGGGGRVKRSASPDTSLYSPVTSRPASPDDLFDFRPNIPRTKGELARQLPRSRFVGRPSSPPDTSRDESLAVNGSGRDEWDPARRHQSSFNQISPRVQDRRLENYVKPRFSRDETSDIDSSWDSKYGDAHPSLHQSNLDKIRTSEVIPNHTGSKKGETSKPWNYNCKPEEEPRETFPSVPTKATGAIPKRRKNPPLPSPVHPDEIIALPMDDFSPPTVGGTSRLYQNYAH